MEQSDAERIQAELAEWLVELRVRAGKPSLREMEDRTRANPGPRVGKSTIGEILSGYRFPTLDQSMAVAKALTQNPESLRRTQALWMTGTRLRKAAGGGGAASSQPGAAGVGNSAAAPATDDAAVTRVADKAGEAVAAADPSQRDDAAPGQAAMSGVPCADSGPSPSDSGAAAFDAAPTAPGAVLPASGAVRADHATTGVSPRRRFHSVVRRSGVALLGCAFLTVAALGAVALRGRSAGAHPTDDSKASARSTPGAAPTAAALRYTVTHEDEGARLVLPAGVALTDKQRSVLEDWSIEDAGPSAMEPLNALEADLRAEGGADPAELSLRVTLENRLKQTVQIDAIQPVDLHRAKPLDGTYLDIPSQGEGPIAKMMFDFDDTEPQARTAEGYSPPYQPGDLYFRQRTLSVVAGEEEDLVIDAVATRWSASFDIGIDYRIGGRPGHLVIDDNGHPFAITPLNCTRPSYLSQDQSDERDGEVKYQRIWKLRDDFQGIDPDPDPAHYRVSVPDCWTNPETTDEPTSAQ